VKTRSDSENAAHVLLIVTYKYTNMVITHFSALNMKACHEYRNSQFAKKHFGICDCLSAGLDEDVSLSREDASI
jgi:hypothetical protein